MTDLVSQNKILKLIVDEFNQKIDAVEDHIVDFKRAVEHMKWAATVQGCYANSVVKDVFIYKDEITKNLHHSAWNCIVSRLNLEDIMPASEFKNFQREIERGLEFTPENFTILRPYLDDQRGSFLRSFAEVFTGLDKFYKSHDNFGVGKKGLPKRIILSGHRGVFGPEYKWGKLLDTINALRIYRNQGKLSYQGEDGNERIHNDYTVKNASEEELAENGINLKLFDNGNMHVHFDKQAQNDINLALHEYYGDVLPDGFERKPEKKQASTAVARDLQFYGTPKAAAKEIVSCLARMDKGAAILEPSCGEGAILEELRAQGFTNLRGVEVDINRFLLTKSKGFSCYHINFLEWQPNRKFDAIVMNPPFYGKHYAKHVRHAFDLLNDGGKLISILPASARYSHKLLDDLKPRWDDLPMGSFKESGTMINTTIATIFK